MDFILTHKKLEKKTPYYSLGEYFLYIEEYNLIKSREIKHVTNEFLVIGDVNPAFKKATQENFSRKNIEKKITKLKNGYLVFIDKEKAEVTIYTDIFGFYQLFYIKSARFVTISSEFKSLIEFSKKVSNEYALLDILFFNYTLLDRTLIKDIKRVTGGTKITIHQDAFNLTTPNNFANNFQRDTKSRKLNKKTFTEILKAELKEDIAQDYPIKLSLTGGFDSRALLAVCKNLDINFTTFTFGQEGNIEQEVANSFIHDYVAKHTFYKLDTQFVENLPDTLNDFIASNLDNPVILDLPQYLTIKKEMGSSNITTGFMGGELMTGQSVGSQVTFTIAASKLLISNSLNEAELHFKNILAQREYLHDKIKNGSLSDYLNSLETYFSVEDKSNILRFLINESYAKFFGAINKTFKNHSNLIVPFVSDAFISYVLNTKISFLDKKPFAKNPLANFRSKIFYAKSIKYLYPKLSETKFDRLYKVKDLCFYYRIPLAAYGYILSHTFKKNKKEYPRPHHFDLWYKNIILNELRNDPNNIYNSNFNIKSNYDSVSGISKKNIAEITAVQMANNKILNL